jgi:catechol 2,3-dioxygenase-like lactoylglutathione lyase family enzyme
MKHSRENLSHFLQAVILGSAAALLMACNPVTGADAKKVATAKVRSIDTQAGILNQPDITETDPLTLRRSTLIVRDMDRSLALYRDAIGMEVIYDNIIRRPHTTDDRIQEIRLVFLKANNDFIGVLGLVDYEHNNPSHPIHTKPVIKEGFTPGNTVVLFNTTELDRKWPLIVAVPGVDIISAPKVTEYPSYDGKDVIRVNVTRFYDPDGFLVEYNQPLDRMK